MDILKALHDTVKEAGSYLDNKINGSGLETATYKEFAEHTYSTARDSIKEALAAADGLPILIVSTEEHEDTMGESVINTFLSDENEEPAFAAAYTHISAIQAAADLVGKENVIVSLEVHPDYVKNTLLSHAEDVTEEGKYYMLPIFEAVRYAQKEGFEIVGSDPHDPDGPTPKGVTSQDRYDSEVEAIGKLALRVEDKPKIVIHIGGAAHVGTLQGYTEDEISSDGDELLRDPQKDPFQGIYGQTVYLNTFHHELRNVTSAIDYAIPNRYLYAMNPYNVIQVDSPGALSEKDMQNVTEYIQSASNKINDLELQGIVNELKPQAETISDPADSSLNEMVEPSKLPILK